MQFRLAFVLMPVSVPRRSAGSCPAPRPLPARCAVGPSSVPLRAVGRPFVATFRYSYRQKKPHLDALMRFFCAESAFRRRASAGHQLQDGVDKLHRLARHGRRLHRWC
jgi:hypothetical protein